MHSVFTLTLLISHVCALCIRVQPTLVLQSRLDCHIPSEENWGHGRQGSFDSGDTLQEL